MICNANQAKIHIQQQHVFLMGVVAGATVGLIRRVVAEQARHSPDALMRFEEREDSLVVEWHRLLTHHTIRGKPSSVRMAGHTN